MNSINHIAPQMTKEWGGVGGGIPCKKAIILPLVFLLFVFSLYSSDITSAKLPNGMQVAVKPISSENVALYCYIKTGAIHEEEYLGHGISHFVEHIVSGGSTEMRTEDEYLELDASIGAEANAFTTYEMTAYHTVVGIEYADIALQMLSEYVFHCIFDEEEVEREKQVILKEILMGDTPHDQSFHGFSEVAQANTHYRYPLIGYAHLFETLTRDDLVKYYTRRYTPHNMLFVAVGGFEPAEMIAKIAATFGAYNRPPVAEIYLPTQPPPVSTYTTRRYFDIERPFIYISRPLPLHKPEDYFALYMASKILFSRRNSPVAYYLEEDTQLVNMIYSYATFEPTINTAELSTFFELFDAEDIDEIIEIYFAKLTEYTKPRKITAKMLADVIRAEEAELYLANETIEEIAEGIGWAMLHHNLPNYDDHFIRELKKVTIADVQRVIAEHYLAPQVIYIALPIEE